MPGIFDHPFLSGLFGDREAATLFEASADIRAMLRFEAALAVAQAKLGLIPAVAASHIAAVAETFAPDIGALAAGTARDGVVIPELVRQLREAVGNEHAREVHLGATSQDVIDTSLVLRLKEFCRLLDTRLAGLIAAYEGLDRAFGARPLTGYTRMQAAIPISVSDRIRAWREPLTRHRGRLASLSFPVQFGGAAGTLDRFAEQGPPLRAALAAALGLDDAPQWQSQRDYVAEYGHVFALVSGSLGKFGQDVALMAQAGGEIALAGGGGSSAMPHKQNPVGAEVLVSLARFNAVQASALQHAMVHEQERSGAAWTLEWMILPQMAMAAAASLNRAQDLAGAIRRLGEAAAP